MADTIDESTSTGTGTLLLTILHLRPESAVCVSLTSDGGYSASMLDGAAVTAGTLTRALRLLLAEIDVEPGALTVEHAAARARVRLPEGGLGTLTRISSRSRVATVHTDEGRWRHLPASTITLYEGTNDE